MPNDAEIVDALYQKYITDAGHPPPSSPAELQSIILTSGVYVDVRFDSPTIFVGMQISTTIYVNGHLKEFKLMKVMAHEWYHALRWMQAEIPGSPISFYAGLHPNGSREESRARLFERKFH